jgi:hypothetical protein
VHTSPIVPGDGPIPELDEPRVRPVHDSPPGRVGDPAEVIPLLAQDHDRIAARDINDIVMERLFFAGLAPETALGQMGGHPEAGKVQEAIDELDLAIRDVRSIVFGHQQPDSPSGGQRG